MKKESNLEYSRCNIGYRNRLHPISLDEMGRDLFESDITFSRSDPFYNGFNSSSLCGVRMLCHLPDSISSSYYRRNVRFHKHIPLLCH
jgi:hypothetical protein